jgi:hypothetical protein
MKKKSSSKFYDEGLSDDEDSKVVKAKNKSMGKKKEIAPPLFKTEGNFKMEMNNNDGIIFYN